MREETSGEIYTVSNYHNVKKKPRVGSGGGGLKLSTFEWHQGTCANKLDVFRVGKGVKRLNETSKAGGKGPIIFAKLDLLAYPHTLIKNLI